jgi:hypothetical protein
MKCLDIAYERRGLMIDATMNEKAALGEASNVVGEYIESIGKTDLATFTESEWDNLVECIVTTYCDKLRELQANEPPFG